MRHGRWSHWIGAGLLSFWLLFSMLGALSAVSLWSPSPAIAQAGDAAAEKAAKAPDKTSKATEKPAEKAANKVSDKAVPVKTAEATESLLHWLGRTLGLRYCVVFLFLTINLAALFVMNTLAVRRDNVVPPALIRTVDSHLSDNRYQDACAMIKVDPSLLGQVLAAGVAQLPSGYDAAVAVMQEVGEHETMKMQQRLGYVALIAQLAPMFGLLGTVDGMVMAFDVIARRDVTPRPSELAVGIGTALVATIVGLWIAIPAIAFYHIVRNRMNRLISEVGILSENLMKRLAAASKRT